MTKETIIAYRLGSRFDGKMSSSSVFDAHLYHALTHKTVLFSVESKNNLKVGKDVAVIDKLILTLKDGSKAFLADVYDFGNYSEKAKPSHFNLPSQWSQVEEEEKDFTWFALENVRELSRDDLDTYINTNSKKPLLESLSSDSSRIYVELA